MEGEKCFSAKPKIVCLPVSVRRQRNNLKRKVVGRLKEQHCKIIALDCRGVCFGVRIFLWVVFFFFQFCAVTLCWGLSLIPW